MLSPIFNRFQDCLMNSVALPEAQSRFSDDMGYGLETYLDVRADNIPTLDEIIEKTIFDFEFTVSSRPSPLRDEAFVSIDVGISLSDIPAMLDYIDASFRERSDREVFEVVQPIGRAIRAMDDPFLPLLLQDLRKDRPDWRRLHDRRGDKNCWKAPEPRR